MSSKAFPAKSKKLKKRLKIIVYYTKPAHNQCEAGFQLFLEAFGGSVKAANVANVAKVANVV